jgi:hypothetical protein
VTEEGGVVVVPLDDPVDVEPVVVPVVVVPVVVEPGVVVEPVVVPVVVEPVVAVPVVVVPVVVVPVVVVPVVVAPAPELLVDAELTEFPRSPPPHAVSSKVAHSRSKSRARVALWRRLKTISNTLNFKT